nr:TBC1 domain family member 13 isoform X4 [Oryctolagus cuniculus]
MLAGTFPAGGFCRAPRVPWGAAVAVETAAGGAPEVNAMSSLHRSRIAEFQDVLKEPSIALEKLRELSFSGIPCEGGLRCLCWKILLNYLPLERASWTSILARQRELYSQFLREMIIQPGIAKANMGVSREDVTFEDHPLNPSPDSRWNTYFKDNEVLLQIDKDVRRLYPDISFFQRATEYPCLLILDPQNEFETLRKRVEQTTLKSQTVARNRSGVTNGMNEIVGPLYYTFATDPNSEWKEHAEADTFFCFTNLMAEIRDNFIKSLDDSQCGITYKMEKVYSTLKDKDMELYLKLQEQNIKPQFFAFRWLMLLLSQEFLLPDVIRIWDTLFADDNRFDFLLLVCCAMLILIREQLLEGDFTVNMRLLQGHVGGFPPPRITPSTTSARSYRKPRSSRTHCNWAARGCPPLGPGFWAIQPRSQQDPRPRERCRIGYSGPSRPGFSTRPLPPGARCACSSQLPSPGSAPALQPWALVLSRAGAVESFPGAGTGNTRKLQGSAALLSSFLLACFRSSPGCWVGEVCGKWARNRFFWGLVLRLLPWESGTGGV